MQIKKCERLGDRIEKECRAVSTMIGGVCPRELVLNGFYKKLPIEFCEF